MTLPDYLADVARALREQSASIRRDFAVHRPSAGGNREDLVERFLAEHLPQRFGVSTGLVISHDGLFSNQADLVVVDTVNNAPLYGSFRNKLWPVESVYALVEVKTSLSPSELRDCVSKGRRFKTLRREFCEGPFSQRITDSLFVIWAFDSPSADLLKAHLVEVLRDVPRSEQPDFVIVPDRLVAKAGAYLEVAVLGQEGSPHRRALQAQHGTELKSFVPGVSEVYDLGDNSLLAWYLWFDSWLRQAGPRLTDPVKYLPPDAVFGRRV